MRRRLHQGLVLAGILCLLAIAILPQLAAQDLCPNVNCFAAFGYKLCAGVYSFGPLNFSLTAVGGTNTGGGATLCSVMGLPPGTFVTFYGRAPVMAPTPRTCSFTGLMFMSTGGATVSPATPCVLDGSDNMGNGGLPVELMEFSMESEDAGPGAGEEEE